jgi:hypothetical protein
VPLDPFGLRGTRARRSKIVVLREEVGAVMGAEEARDQPP